MSKKQTEKQNGEFNELPETIEQVVPKEGIVDLTKRVQLTATETAPFHKAGAKIEVHPVVAEKMKKNGWAK